MRITTPAVTLASLLSLLVLASAAGAQNVPHSSHVWILNEENHSYEQVIGNPQMPYFNQLVSQYGLATQLYADQHGSLPALMWFVAGAPVESNEDTVSCHHTENNILREVLSRGYSWRSYQDNLPYPGYQGLYGGTGHSYYRRHNPLIDFTDVCPGTGQDTNSVPFTQMAQDFANGDTVNFAWVTPDADHDGHNGTLSAADQWLQANLPAILARPEFQPGGDGILFIVWDEGDLYHDSRCSATVGHGCGGRTAAVVIGPQVKPGYLSTNTYHSESVLATVCAAMGLSTCPGAAQNAAPMSDFFSGGSSSSNGIVISSPANSATINGPVHVVATASENEPVSQIQVWDNGAKLGVFGTSVDATYNLAPGQHTMTVTDLDSTYDVIHQASVTYTVEPANGAVQILSPSPGQVISSGTPVHVMAQASESFPVRQVQVWDNGVKLGRWAGSSVDQYFSLAPGVHQLTVTDHDQNYNRIHDSTVTCTVQ